MKFVLVLPQNIKAWLIAFYNLQAPAITTAYALPGILNNTRYDWSLKTTIYSLHTYDDKDVM